MRFGHGLAMVGWLLMPVLAFGQTGQQPNTPQSTGTQPTVSQPANAQPTSPQPANPKPIKPSAVDAAASASKQARESATPSKVIRNHDISDRSNPPEAAKSGPAAQDTAAQAARDKASDEQAQRKARQFETQGKIFQNQVKVQKGKIIDIQNQITSLKDQFAAWSAGFAQDDEAQSCWTSTYYTPYYKDWCDRGRNLKAQYEASQRELGEEKLKLEQMQEDIRRKGYGNGVYDPD
ncbi:MAG: hypothetical protein WB558_01365 [Terriglobales bacterium]